MDAVSKDQKHSSYVARRIYQKQLSRDVAAQGKSCMEKIVGTEREEHTKQMANIVSEVTIPDSTAVADEIETTDDNTIIDVEEVMSIMNATSLFPKEETELLQEVTSAGIGSRTSDDVMSLCGTRTVTTATATQPPTTVAVNTSTVISHSMPTTSSAPDAVIQHEDMGVEVKKELAEEEVARTSIQKRFCPEEDKTLKAGIAKHGLGKWSIMLKDNTLSFHTSRTRHALRMRADTLGLSKRKKSGRRTKTAE